MNRHLVAVDWFRLLWDLVQRGFRLSDVERATGISHSTLRGYMDGSHPPHWRGELLIALWCQVCTKPRHARPTVEVVIAPRVVEPRPQVQASAEAVVRLEAAWMGRAQA